MLILKQPKTKTSHKILNFLPQFIPRDGHQMVNVNIFYIGLFFSLWCNILLFNYSRFVILTNYKNQRITLNTNQFLNPYMQQHNTCNNLKPNLDYMELKKIQNTKYNVIWMLFSIKILF